MNPVGLTSMPLLGEAKRPDSQERVRDAAEQFEALLIGQILRSAREAGEEKGDAATEFAEQHLANVLSHNGGLGIANMIAASLARESSKS